MSKFEYPPQTPAPLTKPHLDAAAVPCRGAQPPASARCRFQSTTALRDSSSASLHSTTDKMKLFSILPALLAVGTAAATDAWSFKDASVAVVSKSGKGGFKET